MFAAGPAEFDNKKALAAAMLAAAGVSGIKLAGIFRSGLFGFGSLFAVLVGLVLALAVVGRFILGPLDAAARHRRRPTQFTMADFLALMFLFQLPVALIRLVLPTDAPQLKFLYFFAWIASSLMWALSVQTLSRAGVETPWRRVVFLSAVLPIAYFGSVVFMGAILLAVSTVLFDAHLVRMRGFWWYIAWGAVLPFAFCWAARFVRTMLAGSRAEGSSAVAGAEAVGVGGVDGEEAQSASVAPDVDLPGHRRDQA